MLTLGGSSRAPRGEAKKRGTFPSSDRSGQRRPRCFRGSRARKAFVGTVLLTAATARDIQQRDETRATPRTPTVRVASHIPQNSSNISDRVGGAQLEATTEEAL